MDACPVMKMRPPELAADVEVEESRVSQLLNRKKLPPGPGGYLREDGQIPAPIEQRTGDAGGNRVDGRDQA